MTSSQDMEQDKMSEPGQCVGTAADMIIMENKNTKQSVHLPKSYRWLSKSSKRRIRKGKQKQTGSLQSIDLVDPEVLPAPRHLVDWRLKELQKGFDSFLLCRGALHLFTCGHVIAILCKECSQFWDQNPERNTHKHMGICMKSPEKENFSSTRQLKIAAPCPKCQPLSAIFPPGNDPRDLRASNYIDFLKKVSDISSNDVDSKSNTTLASRNVAETTSNLNSPGLDVLTMLPLGTESYYIYLENYIAGYIIKA
ncbi:hypothetical protein BS50DRAFT_136504 [Corynespora cassiicola Philippines]|uniref:Uncharacterized protein n=1 Tax=Corynespora cassiicola Philippines TaxID=1448308 RepID=A0A2T2N9D2_CORCC|nr:hypothetical protein BS50DRAFT_136504 [Corynespora cassiicola Philippines]